jgi:hypothetical protein
MILTPKELENRFNHKIDKNPNMEFGAAITEVFNDAISAAHMAGWKLGWEEGFADGYHANESKPE